MAEKIIEMTGLCENCDNRSDCDFIKEIRIFMKEKRSAEKIIDTNIAIYSCDNYNVTKDTCPSDGICLYCNKGSEYNQR